MRLPWYRSLPFSTVEIAAVSLDGEAIDLTQVRVEYDGESWSLAEMAEQTDAFWFVRDSAFLLVPGRTLIPGSQHEVALIVNVNPPYIPGMKRSNPQVATLRVA
jgi:hypothetical protein